MMPRCPICNREVHPPKPGEVHPSGRRVFPFCSERCRQVDLGKWLEEEYRVPIASWGEDEDGAETTESEGRAEGRAPRSPEGDE
jgi:endogenous inhibitor of DNA gyrase (YacG/DUF329 family)